MSSKKPRAIAYTRKSKLLKHRADMPSEYKVCGFLMQAHLAVTSEGLPLGLATLCFWSRRVFKNTRQLKHHRESTRIPIEKKKALFLVRLRDGLSQVILRRVPPKF
jgi:hypothetical protein